MLRDPDNIEREFLQDLLGSIAGTILEIGCGDGRLTSFFTDVSDRIVALDPDPSSILKARSFVAKGVRLVLGSGENVPLADGSIDTVIFSLSLHHHPEPGRALLEAKRVLRDGGHILVLEPQPEALTNRLYRRIHNEDDAYEKAVAAILASGLKTNDEGTYETSWRFSYFDEMVGYLFNYFDREPEQDIIDNMALTLADRKDSRPLELEDITRYWLLRSDQGIT